MTYSRPLFFSATAFITIALSSCSDSATTQTIEQKSQKVETTYIEVVPDITIRPTIGFALPEKMQAVTFAPNLTASWMGRVLMVGESGTLYSTTLDQANAKAVTIGQYKDVMGLVQKDIPVSFAAITNAGEVEIFQETQDQMDYFKLKSSPEIKISGFCKNGGASMRLRAKNDELYDVTITDKVATLNKVDTSTMRLAACASDTVVNSLKPNPTGPHLLKGETIIGLENALSVATIKNVALTYSSPVNMGSTFNQGASIVVSKDEPYMVAISKEYLDNKLGN